MRTPGCLGVVKRMRVRASEPVRGRELRPEPAHKVRKALLLAVVLLIPAAGLGGGCGGQSTQTKSTTGTTQTIKAPGESEMKSFFGLTNGMALELHKQIFTADPGKNVFLSPASLEMALAMAENGASGETLAAMKKTLGLASLDIDQVNRSNKAYIDSLAKLDPTIQLEIANSLWLRKDLSFNEEFLEDNKKYYDAEVSKVDFADPATAAEINRWVSEKTKGKITDVAPPPPDSNFTLADAIYFKGTWLYPFDKSKTSDAEFNLLDGDSKMVPMMSQLCSNAYYENDRFQMVVLRYGEANSGGNRVSMYVFLPRDVDGINEFVDGLDSENWKSWISGVYTTQVDLKLPRFTIEYDTMLNGALSSMGMGIAFGADADFSRMLSGNGSKKAISLTSIQQKSFVDVNEEGTEAAAVTVIAEGEGERNTTKEVHPMVVDHPFFFAICDDASGAILFTGTVLAP